MHVVPAQQVRSARLAEGQMVSHLSRHLLLVHLDDGHRALFHDRCGQSDQPSDPQVARKQELLG